MTIAFVIRNCAAASLIAILLTACSDDKPSETTSTGDPESLPNTNQPSPAKREPTSPGLLEARQGFTTQFRPTSYQADGAATEPPPELFRLVKYTSPAGELAAYLTPDPQDGIRHPAVLWCHGGFGGIGSWFWEDITRQNDQSARAFREAGIVVMCPSWRGENDNPGKYEQFFGEVNDLLAARDFLTSLPYVDPQRIYLAGHSTGGTMTLLGVCATDKFRAAFSFGGDAVYLPRTYPFSPFDTTSAEEVRLRSALNFVSGIRTRTFYFEGESSAHCAGALQMERLAQTHGTPFRACIIREADHFNILAPLTEYVAQQILADTGSTCQIEITNSDANIVFRDAWERYRTARAAAAAKFPVIELTAAAHEHVRRIAQHESLDLHASFLRVGASKGWKLEFDDTFNAETDVKIEQMGVSIVVAKSEIEHVQGHMIDYVQRGDRDGFIFVDRVTE